ncbi:UDP-glycosyltransferase 74G1-like [Gastrolobium bilobum]|uniref:UDP-glycosyltransferase 74G1-like n=1 Tax=Gastrolobium bilobum TaxID=150636 RepID=UPI002AB1F47D|nr:UDP-glycosyltransferase 74G1-like [Gastrolobium bilobum]
MEKKNVARRVHCLVLAYPAQGHINPMLQFSKILQHEGVRVTLVTASSFCKNMQNIPSSIALETISDGFDNGGFAEAGCYKAYLERFWQVGPETLAELLEKLDRSSDHVDCVIYNSFMPWALEVARRFGIIGAVFLTQNLSVNSIYYHVQQGMLRVPLTENEINLPALPKLQLGDLPSFFLFTDEDNRALFDYAVGQFSNIDKADWILCNAFYEMEKEVADWTMKIWSKFRTIGPSIPSMFLDKRLKDDQDYGVAQFKSEECMKWLDDKPKWSVVYVSFGSMAELDEEQIEELAFGLRDSGSYFLWVVRASEETKLPKDFEKKSEKGLIVTWCSQLKVLAHEAVGCFVTHCGWNSTLEALSLGVPMVTMPNWSDQSTNAKQIVDVWKTGIRASVDEKRIVRQEVLKHCISEIMESERGKELKSNAMQWKTLAAGAVGKDGSSQKNVEEFVNSLFHLLPTCNEPQIIS